jgi:hypothetical protein
MTDKDSLVKAILQDGPLMTILRSEVQLLLRPLRHERVTDFDLRPITYFHQPDNMMSRIDQLVSDFAHHIVDRLLPDLEKAASDEAKHNLIRKLVQVLN